MIPKNIIAAAERACADSRARFQAGDTSVTAAEGEAYLALVGALKTEGMFDPMAELTIAAAHGHVRTSHSPLARRGLTALALAAVLLYAGQAFAAGACTYLMTNQSASGPGPVSVSSNPTPGETGAERHSFQYHGSAQRIAVQVQRSDDGGATWKTLHTFGKPTHDSLGTDEIWPIVDGIPACGTCAFRAWKPVTSPWGTATVTHVISGAALDLTTPTP